jgi:glycosyltransferase involved in cell wall biosynthesis
MPELSILMPVFNAAGSLALAVRSTLAAMPRDAELVVLNDGSSDNSLAMLHQMAEKHPRMRVMSNRENTGVAATLGQLLDSCDSAIVARMDADDIALPWRFRIQRQCLVSSGVDAIFSTVVHYAPQQLKIWPQRALRITPDKAPFALLLGNPFAHSTLMAWTESIHAVGGYREVPSEDYDLWLRLALSKRRLLRTRMPTVLYRHHPSQVTLNDDWLRRAQYDTLTANVHAELSQQLLGWEDPVFFALRGDLLSADDVRVVTKFLSIVHGTWSNVLGSSRVMHRQEHIVQKRLSKAAKTVVIAV